MLDSDTDTDQSDTEEATAAAATMRCLSCKEEYSRAYAGTCKECYEEASETEEDLKREIEDLKSKISLLKLFSPLDLPSTSGGIGGRFGGGGGGGAFFTDVVLVASSDEGTTGSPVPVPAHKAVLVGTHLMNFDDIS